MICFIDEINMIYITYSNIILIHLKIIKKDFLYIKIDFIFYYHGPLNYV